VFRSVQNKLAVMVRYTFRSSALIMFVLLTFFANAQVNETRDSLLSAFSTIESSLALVERNLGEQYVALFTNSCEAIVIIRKKSGKVKALRYRKVKNQSVLINRLCFGKRKRESLEDCFNVALRLVDVDIDFNKYCDDRVHAFQIFNLFVKNNGKSFHTEIKTHCGLGLNNEYNCIYSLWR